MPDLPRPNRLSLHDAINYVAERCGCDTERAGKAVYAALGEGALRLDAHLLSRESPTLPPVAGIVAVPSQVWVNYPWPQFQTSAVLPRGIRQYRERAGDGHWIGPVYSDPTIATSAVDSWLGSIDDRKRTEHQKELRYGGDKLSAEDILAEIERYEQRLTGILSRFRGHDLRSLGMAEPDTDIYPQLVIEIAELLRDVLGPDNSYTANIRVWDNTFNKSYDSVKNIVATIRAAHTHITRNPKILSEQRSALDESQKVQQVFIGHGHSLVWRELQDFLEKRLKLSVEEFNSVSVAGIPTATRLEETLRTATFAFLVMTAEDETPDGKFRARMNVVHEVGLFQGKLGFKKAIILLEDGCEDFSNIDGLGQIRFPKGKLAAKFEEIRQVLEREDIITP